MKWKPFTKRLLSLLLAAVMLAGTIPAASLTAYAEETSQQPDAQSDVQYTYTLNFDGNGDGVSGVPAPVTVTVTDPEYAIDIQPDQMNVTRPGYKFMGWCDNADGTGKTYKSGMVPVSFTKDNATKTVYAKWEADEVTPTTPSTPTAPTTPPAPPAPTEYTYSIVYHGNVDDNSVTNLPETETVNTVETSYGFQVSRVTPVRDGYDFTHWYKTPECTGQYQGLGWTLTATPDNPTIHLYAGWKVHVHQHTYAYTDNGDGTHSATCSDPTCGDVIDHEAHTYTSKVTKQPTLVETGERTYTCSKCGNSYTEEIPVVVPSAPTLKEISKLEQGQLVWIVDNYNVNADGKPGPAKYYPKQIDREESIHAPQSEDEYTLTAPVMEGDAYYCTLTIKASTIEKWIEEYKEYASNKDWEVDTVNSHSVNDFTYLLEYKYQDPWHVVKDSSGYTANDVYGKAIFMIHTKHNFHVRGPWVEDAEKGIATRRCDVGSTERSDVYRCNYTEVKPLSVDAAQILSDLSIRLSCQTNETDSKTVGLIPESLTAGEIVAGANSVYTCNVTLDCSKYLPEGHTLADGQSETISITLTWTPNAQRDNGSWSADTTEASIQVSCTSVQGPALPTEDYLNAMQRGYVIYAVENYNVNADGTPGTVKTSTSARDWRFNAIPGTYTLSEVTEKDGVFYCTLTITDLTPYVDGYLDEYETSSERYALDTVHTDSSSFTYVLKWTGSTWQYDESNGFNAAAGKNLYMYHTKHYSNDKWTVQPATCEEDGLRTMRCSHLAGARQNTTRCTYVISEVIPATGHTWDEGVITKEATTAAPGEKTYTCTACGATKVEEIPQLAPALPTEDYLNAMQRGYVIYAVENYNVNADGTPGTVKTSTSARDWRFNAIPGTYTLSEVTEKDGVFYCTLTITDLTPYVDGYLDEYETSSERYALDTVHTDSSSFTYVLKWTGSTWQYDESNGFNAAAGKNLYMYHTKHYSNDKWTVQPATCEEDGLRTMRCSHLAGARQNTTRCTYVISEVIPATGHTWGEWEVTKAPTCTEAGEQTRTCSVCGKTETETLEAAGHTWSDEWTHDADSHWQVCTVCGEAGEKTAHAWDKGTVTKAPTLTEAGEKTYTCTVCGETKTEVMLPPTPITNEIVESARQPGFIYVLENKSPAGKAPAYVGNINNDTSGRQITSRRPIAGTYTIGEPYEQDGKFYCEVIINDLKPYLDAFIEKYPGVTYKIDTANSSASYRYTLQYVGYDSPADECSWRMIRCEEKSNRLWITHEHYTTGAWTVTKEATCTGDGERSAVCAHCYKLTPTSVTSWNCRETFTEAIPATGHDWDEGVVTKEPAIGVPGEMTFTCKNDPTHTKVEEIPALVQQTVKILVYRNGNTEKPYTTASLDGYVKGDTLDISALNIADYYSRSAMFEGWYNDGGWNQYLAGNHNRTLGDTITINGWTNIYCMVTDYENVVVKAVYDGDKDNAQTVYTGKALHGADLNAFLEENVTGLEKEGYTLDKWYNWDWYGHKVAENATVNGWTNVYITYTAKEYTVSFDANADGEVDDPAAQTVKYGSTASAPAISRTNWDFLGWYAEGAEEPFDFTTPITGDLTLTARWEKGTSHKPAASKQITSKQVDVMQIRAYAVGTEVVMSTKEMASCTPTCYAKGVSYTIGDVYGNDVDGYRQDVTFRFISGDTFEAKASSVFLTHGGLKNHPEWIGNTWVYDFDYEDFEAEQTLTFLWHEKQLPSGLWNRYWSIDDPKYHNNSNIKSATANFIHAYLYLERTVTYADGVEGEELFADQIYTVRANTDTPAFEGTPSREGWIFQGWNPQVSEKVTADVTYVAQWKHDCAAAVQHIARVEPTCEEDGNIEYWYCANCGKYFTDEACTQEVTVEETIIPATGHDWKSVGKIDATCTTPEYTLYQCGNDPHHIKQEVTGEALGHDYKAVVTEPTCTEGGYTTYTCTRCGETHVDDFTAPKGHSWDEGTIITAPGCAEDGVKEYTCTVCGEKKQENIGATGHTFVETKHEPNCTECGWITHTCSVCGFTYDSDHVAALGHDYEETVVAPTCTTAGYTQYTCKRCDHSYTDKIVQPTGHKYETKVEEPTCTEMGKTWEVCSVCGDKRLIDVAPALGHDFSDEWTVDVEPTCEEEGSKSRHCSRCDARIDITAIPATGHDWDEGVVTKEPTCGEEGIRTFTCKNDPTHTYTESIAKLDHVWNEEGVVTKEPTCEEPGEMTYTCVNDETHTKTEPISALGHDWDEGKVTKAPTCTEEGVKTFTCKNDPTHTRTEAIAAKGHTASDWKHNSGSHWQVCTECGEIIDGSKGSHVDKDSNGKCDVCGVKLVKTDSNGNPKTGDPAPIAVIATVLLISAAGICLILLLYYRKRSSRKDS